QIDGDHEVRFLGDQQPRKRRQMPSGSLQWAHLYGGIDKGTRVSGYSKQIQLINSSSRPPNGIVKPFLFFDNSIGNRITLSSKLGYSSLQSRKIIGFYGS